MWQGRALRSQCLRRGLRPRRSPPPSAMHPASPHLSASSLNRDYVSRSLLGSVAVFNLLPDFVFYDPDDKFKQTDVHGFQKNLSEHTVR